MKILKVTNTLNGKTAEKFYQKPLHEALVDFLQNCEIEFENQTFQNEIEKIKNEILKKTGIFVKDYQGETVELQKILEDIKKIFEEDFKLLESWFENKFQKIEIQLQELQNKKVLDLSVKLNDNQIEDLGLVHYQFPILLDIIKSGLNVYLVGPAGSGKTHAAEMCAKALGIPFYFTGAIANEYKLTGFIDAQGRIISTEFRKAYEEGGLFLFDEVDASFPQAVLAFNAALANNYMDFPDKRVQKHPNFYCIAAANTYGQGADRQYVGRNQLDAATLDRFVFLEWNYDENLERVLANNDTWVDYVQKVRKFIHENKIRHVISTRASINGAKLLANHVPLNIVENSVIWKGLDETTVVKIKSHIKPIHTITYSFDKEAKFIPLVKDNQVVNKDDSIGKLIGLVSQYTFKAPVNGLIKSIFDGSNIKKGDIVAKIQEL